MGDATAPGNLDRQRRLVDREDIMAACLKIEAHAPCTTAGLETAPAPGAHSPPLDRRPATVWREVIGRVAAVDQAVVTLHDLLRLAAIQQRLVDLTVRVLIGTQPGVSMSCHACTLPIVDDVLTQI